MTLLTDPLLTSRYDGSGMYTSGSGQGPQNLAQRTISKQVTQQYLIGSGRFNPRKVIATFPLHHRTAHLNHIFESPGKIQRF